MVISFNQSINQFTFPVFRTRQGSQQTITGKVLTMLSLDGNKSFNAVLGQEKFHLARAVVQGQGTCTWLTLRADAGAGQQRP